MLSCVSAYQIGVDEVVTGDDVVHEEVEYAEWRDERRHHRIDQHQREDEQT